MAGKADCLKELNVYEDATPYGSEFQTLIVLMMFLLPNFWRFCESTGFQVKFLYLFLLVLVLSVDSLA